MCHLKEKIIILCNTISFLYQMVDHAVGMKHL